MKQIKRALSILLVLAMCFSLLPTALAVDSKTGLEKGVYESTGELTIKWGHVKNAKSYTLNLYKIVGEQSGTTVDDDDIKIDEVSKVYDKSVTSVDVTDVVKTYGPGKYLSSIFVDKTSGEPETKYATVVINQLSAPENVLVDLDDNNNAVVSWDAVEYSHGYKITANIVDGEGQTVATKEYTTDGATSVDITDFVQQHKNSDSALTVSVSVVAVGSLSDKECRSLNSEASTPSASLEEKVGVLPTPVITDNRVISRDGKLYVAYGFEGGSVGVEYIDSLTLTLTHATSGAKATYTVNAQDIKAQDGLIDVTMLDEENVLPTGTYQAQIVAAPKYPALNEPTSSTATVGYGTAELASAVLTVDNAGTQISWPQVALSEGTLDDVADYTVEYKQTGETDWKTVSIAGGNAIQMAEDGTLYLDISGIVANGGDSYDFKVIASNSEDLTMSEQSEATVTVYKTYAVEDVKIDAENYEDAVYVTWTAPSDKTGIANYQVDVYENGTLKQSFNTADAQAQALDISEAIVPGAVRTYTVKVTAIGTHAQGEVFYADSAVAEGANEVTSGKVEAAKIEFKTRQDDDTSYIVYFAGKDATALPENVEGYQVTISYELESGAKSTWTGIINDISCDITTLKAQNGNPFMSQSNTGDYVNAEFTVKAIALSTNTALHKNAGAKTVKDTFELTALDASQLQPVVSTTDGKTFVTWNQVPGATDYDVTVQFNGKDNFVGRFSDTYKANITNWLNQTGTYTVTVSAKAIEGSTVYMDGSSSVEVTVLAAPVVTVETSVENDTAVAKWNADENAQSYLVTVLKDGAVVDGHNAVSVTATEYDITQIIKANGAGKYTVQVTAVGNGSEYITSLTAGEADIEITKLSAPGVTFALNASKAPVVTITAVDGEAPESYTVYLYANGELIATLTEQKAGNIPVTSYVKEYKGNDAAVSFSVEVVAEGSLGHNTLSSDKANAELAEKAGKLPAVEITSTQIVQDNGVLKVNYKITDNGVGLGAIAKAELTLKKGSTVYTYTKVIHS